MATLTILSVGPSSSAAVNVLLSGRKWSSTELTYSFRAGAPEDSDFATGFAPLNERQQAAARQALARWAAVCNITITEVADDDDGGIIRFGTCSSTIVPTSGAYYPNDYESGGDVWFGNSNANSPNNPLAGGYAFNTFVHELGHSLGLKHPHEIWGVFPKAGLAVDAMQNTVMSYRSYLGDSTSGGYSNAGDSFPSAPMAYDIAAVQYLYGANYDFNSGDTRYVFNPDKAVIFGTIWDGGGDDTYDLSAYATAVSVSLLPGAWTTSAASQLARLNYYEVAYGYSATLQMAPGNVCNAFLFKDDTRSLIENVIGGAGDDSILCNQADNAVRGGRGDDTLKLGRGNDTVLFSAGDGRDFIADTVFSAGDTIVVSGISRGQLTVRADDRQFVAEIAGTGDSIRWTRSVVNPSVTVDETALVMASVSSVGTLYAGDGLYAGTSASTADLVYAGTESGIGVFDLQKDTARFYSVEYFDNHGNVAGGSVLRGTAGNNVLTAAAASADGQGDMLWGRGGDDTLVGGNGADTFWYGQGEGADVIAGNAAENADKIMLYTAMTTSEVSVSVAGDDLVLTLGSGVLTVLGGIAWAEGTSGAFMLADRSLHDLRYFAETKTFGLV